MNRIIKFRARNTEGKWLYFTLQDLSSGLPVHIIAQGLRDWSEWTNLTDKNGKEIYEGDVLRMKQTAWGFIEHLIVIEWNDEYFQPQAKVVASNGDARGTARVGDAYGFIVLHRHKEQVEVIGNIYENPELVEKA